MLEKLKLKNKWLKIGVFTLLGGIILGGFALGFNALNQYLKTAQAEDIVATAPVSGNYTANLILSPDGSTAYVSNSGYTSTPGISKYDTNNNTLTSFLAIGENQTILNSTGTKLYAFTSSDIKVIDTSSFSIESTIVTPNVGAGFLSGDDSKLFAVTGSNEVRVYNTSDNSEITTINTLLPSASNGISTTNSANLNGSGLLNNNKTKLYLVGSFNTAIIDISSNTFEGLIPVDAANSSINSRGVSISMDDTKMYAPDPSGFRVIDLATKKLERILVGSRADFIQSRADKIYIMDALRKIKVYDSQTYKLISENTIFTDLTNLQINSFVVSPDTSKVYITGIRSGGVTYVGNPLNLTPIFGPSDNFLMVVDLNTFEVDVNGGFNSNAKIQRFSNDGKRAYITDEGSYKVIDTTLVNTADILSFDCTSPTNTLGSVVTCTVNTSNNVRGLVKFDVGLESCTAYFDAIGGSSASCTYIANNIQSTDVIINPSFGSPSTNGALTINGSGDDITVDSSNLNINNNCTVSGNVKINAEFNCIFSLTGSSTNSYILPSGGIKIGVNSVSDKSDLCLIIGNGTSNAELDCKNIPTVGGSIGTQDIEVFINNSTLGANVGNINLTDGFLVNSTTDTVDAIPGDGYCGDLNGDCTLRSAVMEANSDYLKDKITIPAGVYQLTIAPTDTPNVTENKGAIDGDLDVTSDIDFIGTGKDTTFIQSGSDNINGIDRVFHIFNTNVNFNDLTIRYGRVNNISIPPVFQGLTESPQNGGGIYYQKFEDFDVRPQNTLEVYGFNLNDLTQYGTPDEYKTSLNLTNVIISDNYAQNSGGGVYNAATISSFTNSEFKNNKSDLYGGGISRAYFKDRSNTQTWNGVTIKTIPITTSNSFNGNSIENANFEIVNSIIFQNESVNGAGLYHERAKKINIDENTQITSNIANNRGGGIYNAELIGFQGVGTITINGATINSNTADQGGAIYNESGHVETLPGNLTSKNTLIQYNNAVQGSAWYTLAGLSEATNTSIYENNTQNTNYDYNTARTGTSVFRIETGDLKINKSMLLGNWGRGVEVNGGNVIIDSSTIDFTSGRAVSSSNGASVPDNGNNITIINSTITRGNAPAIYLADNKTVLTGKHLTILDNPYGLAVNELNLSTIRLDNSIIGRSAFRNCADGSGNPLTLNIGDSSRGSNISNNSDCALVFGFTENADVANFLGPLQFNGGPTLTIELLSGNPAIDGGSGSPTYDGSPASPATDQRGEPRPTGSNYDVGAFEVQVLSPRANDDTASTDVNSSVSVDVLANDTQGVDPIDTNSVTIVDQPSKGSLNDDGNGNFTYTPDSGQFSVTDTDTFTYYFFDSIGVQSNTATVTITVNVPVVNAPPIANDDAASGNEVDPIVIDILANDSDSDGTLDFASVFIQDQPQKGNLSINNSNGQVTYTPNSSLYALAGSDTFTYKVKDNSGDYSNLANVTVNITPQSKIISASCDPRFGYLTITSTCIAEFTTGRSGTITFTNSVSNCTTNNINSTDTTASCNFTISVPSINPYDVNLSTTQGEFLNSVDSIYVSPLPNLVSMTPNLGPTTGGTTTVADLSMIPGNERNFAVSTDQSGNIYVAGEVFGTIKAGNDYLNGNGGEDIFVAKYDSNQNLIWARLAGGTGNDRATGLVVNGGDVYITGYFKSAAKFGNTNIISLGNTDVFVSKLDTNGNWIWTTSGGGVAADEAYGVDKDSNNNIYIAGRINAAGDFSGSAKFGNDTLISNGLTDIFVSKLDSNGNWIWTTRGGGSAFDFAESISVSNNSVYISGTYNNNTTIGSTNLVLDMGRTGYDSYLAKLDNSGNWLWAKDIGNTGVDTFAQDFAYSGEVYSDSAGNAYIMGSFYKDFIDFGSVGVINNSSTKTVTQRLTAATAGEGIAQHYIAKASPNGDWLWAKQLGQIGYGFSSSFEALNNSTGYVVTTLYDSDINLAGQPINKTNSFYNSIIAKINLNDGALSNILPSSGTGGSEIIRDIATDPSGNLILVGNSSGLSKFGSETYQSTGLFDSTILKYNTTTNTFSSMSGLGGIVPFFIDFGSALNSIKFDGLNANITIINSPIQATVVSPAHPAGFVDVQATNSIPLSSTLNNGFQYIPLPVANPDTATTIVTSPLDINVTNNDTTSAGTIDLTTVTIETQPTKGIVSVNPTTGITTYTPTLSAYSGAGSDTFTYKVKDSNGNFSNTATVTINVTFPPQPQAIADSISTPQSTAITIPVLSNDINATNICTGSISGVNNGSAVIINDSGVDKITFTPANGFIGSTIFTYTACSTVAATSPSAPAQVTVTVIQTAAPVANDDIATTLVSSSVDIPIIDNDVASVGSLDLTSVTIVTQPSKGNISVNPTTGNVIYTPTLSQFSTAANDAFTYKIKDSNGNFSNLATVTVSVTFPPQPIANPDTISTPESTSVIIPVLSNDVNATNICIGSINLGSNTANGTAVITTTGSGNNAVDKITFTPTQGYFGTTTFTYTACSTVAGTNPSTPATVTVNVTQVNPIAVNDTATTNQNESITIPVLSNDSDPSGQTLNICTPLSTPNNGTITKITVSGVAQIIFTPTFGYFGNTTFTYTACDPGGNASNTATVNITVVPNSIPIANPDTVSTAGSNPIAINVPSNDTDSDGSLDLTSVTIVNAPSKGNTSINPTNGIITYTATTAMFTTDGVDTFTYKIKDNKGDFSNTTTVTINVAVNPIANPDNASTTVPNPVTINVASNDTKTSADLDLASVTIVTQPTKGTVSVVTTANSPDLGKIIYTPTTSAFTSSGSDTFTYYIKDLENHTSNTTTVNISVVLPGSNQIPVANSDTATGNKNNPITVNVPANDTDSDGTLDLTSVTIVTQPTKGTITVNPTTGAITYTPTSSSYSASSTDTFTYKIKDNDGDFSNIATVTLNINLTLPMAINDTATTDQNNPITVDVLANDINATNICQNSVQTTTTNGTVLISNNKVIYTPKKDFNGTDSFTYKACNIDGESNAATITITVKPAPLPVVVQNVDLKLYKDTPTQEIILNKSVKVQADITNPNNFMVDKIETIITIDTNKVEFIRDSAKQGTIDGTKYSNISNILKTLGIKGNAATNTTLEFISDSQLKVTSYNVAPGETIPVVFNVIPKANIQNSITGKSDIINPATNQSIAQAQAQTDLKPIEITPMLVRTGGEIIWIGLGLITIIGAIAFGPRIIKRFKIRVK